MKIALLGTMDTKGDEFRFVADFIKARGHETVVIDVGTDRPPLLQPDISREEVAAMAALDLKGLIDRHDRGECVGAMAKAAEIVLSRLQSEGKIDAVISLGGGGGTAIATAGMRALPIGFPKVMVSTLASGNTAHYVGVKDVVMFPAIVDVAGVNRISRVILSQAAGAICGMVEVSVPPAAIERPIIVASMFGNTTDCVQHAKSLCEAAGYETLIFAATGTGGRTMESLIEAGMIAGVLDLTTTEWADELMGGVLCAGPNRMEATGKAGIPAVVAPGCLDMVNFGARDTVPAKYADRLFYQHNPQVTLMRTTAAECSQLGKIIADKVNAYRGPVTLLLPLKGISVISAPGGAFYDPVADEALFTALKSNINERVKLLELDVAINDPVFSEACANELLGLLRKQ